ncbi:MAG TPA: bifunctional salicylyl-CoA 5-hydroxylase/oxidoreductase, partial [Rhodospirillales bacterium]|nr:bifunctional salicylyl-CoA 5-hydroxylase/oxidoreductase [Rhodospirillales bacterium]
LAMEDAVALNDSINGFDGNLLRALPEFQKVRQPAVDSIQRAAKVSMEWFEDVERYYDKMEPMEFSYSLLTRSLRINHENLRFRDTKLVAKIDAVVAEKAAQQSGVPVGQITPPQIFTPYKLRDMVLDNRITLSPMCMYSATNGIVGDWHLVHLGSRAMGGAGLIMTECTAITAEGRITLGCSGMYSDDHINTW